MRVECKIQNGNLEEKINKGKIVQYNKSNNISMEKR